jgi:hypothetical protein
VAFNQRDQHEAAAGCFNFGSTHNLLGPVVTPLDQDIGSDRGDEIERCIFMEDRDGIDRLEGAQDLGASLHGIERPAWSFQAPDAFIRVQPHDEVVALLGGLS